MAWPKTSTPECCVSDAQSMGKLGPAGYGELGLDLFRTRTTGGSIGFRADAPAFTIDDRVDDPNNPSRHLRTSMYLPVLSGGIALRL